MLYVFLRDWTFLCQLPHIKKEISERILFLYSALNQGLEYSNTWF